MPHALPLELLLAALAALAAGVVNALAGGGTLITFPHGVLSIATDSTKIRLLFD